MEAADFPKLKLEITVRNANIPLGKLRGNMRKLLLNCNFLTALRGGQCCTPCSLRPFPKRLVEFRVKHNINRGFNVLISLLNHTGLSKKMDGI